MAYRLGARGRVQYLSGAGGRSAGAVRYLLRVGRTSPPAQSRLVELEGLAGALPGPVFGRNSRVSQAPLAPCDVLPVPAVADRHPARPCPTKGARPSPSDRPIP